MCIGFVLQRVSSSTKLTFLLSVNLQAEGGGPSWPPPVPLTEFWSAEISRRSFSQHGAQHYRLLIAADQTALKGTARGPSSKDGSLICLCFEDYLHEKKLMTPWIWLERDIMVFLSNSLQCLHSVWRLELGLNLNQFSQKFICCHPKSFQGPPSGA